MALSITAANVTSKSSSSITNGTSGEALSQGSVVFLDSDNKFYKASAASDGDLTGKTIGICLCIADAANERAIVATTNGDEIDLGVTAVKGTYYCIGGTDGAIETYSDLASSEHLTWIGYGNGSNLILQINPTGFTK
jgi:hypothetical protein